MEASLTARRAAGATLVAARARESEMRVRTSIISVVAAGLLLAAPSATPVAHARPIICEPSTQWATISDKTLTRVVTHVKGIFLAPHTSYSQTTSISKVNSVTAGVTLSAGASVSSNFILAKAEASVGVELRASGSSTTQTSYSETWSINNTSDSQRRYALWAGTVRWSGKFVYHRCNADGSAYSTSSGTWRSWTTMIDGTALCPASRYGSATFEYKALVRVGC